MGPAEAVAFLDSRIRFGMRPGLERMAAVAEALGQPQRSYPVIHVAGTNGKFSVVRMVAAILTELGLVTGVYTSPHLEHVRERIELAGQPITLDALAERVTYLRPLLEAAEGQIGDELTYFELATLLAFECFFDRAVHVAVVEAGLGGEYDATNVVEAQVACLTNVSSDHVAQFGGDLSRAAWEKAGITKDGTTLVTGVTDPETFAVITERAAELRAAAVAQLDRDFAVTDRTMAVGGQLIWIRGLHADYEELFLPVFGEHQATNLALAIAASEAFAGGAVDADALHAALGGLTLPGRLEVASHHPLVVCDGGHNPAASVAVRAALTESLAYQRLTMVVGMFQDKQIRQVLDPWAAMVDRFIATRPANDRAADPGELAGVLEAAGVAPDDIDLRPVVGEALDVAVDGAEDGDAVLVFGSFATVGEARARLRQRGLLQHP